MPRAKRKATPPPALAREAFLKEGGKEADILQEALKNVENLALGKRTTEEVNKIAADYGIQPKAVSKAWDDICKKAEVRGGDPRSTLNHDENEELVRLVLDSYLTANFRNPPIEGFEIRQYAADCLAKRNIILPYIDGLPNINWLQRWRNSNALALRGEKHKCPDCEPLVISRKRKASPDCEPLVIPRKRKVCSSDDDTCIAFTGEELGALDELDSTGSAYYVFEKENSDESEGDYETEDEEDALDNEHNGRYMRFVNLEPGEGEYMRHPECRLTKAGAKEFGIPDWLLYMYE